ncbi:MAG: hypothetical protein ACE145_13650 [Terriglobia bacterium]
MENEFITAAEVAKLLDISPATLYAREKDGLIPPPKQFIQTARGKVRVWSRAEVEGVRDALAKRPRSPYGALRALVAEYKHARAEQSESDFWSKLAYRGDHDLMPAAQLAELLNVSIQQVYTWIKPSNPTRPRFWRDEQDRLYFRLHDIERWLEDLAFGVGEKPAEQATQPPVEQPVKVSEEAKSQEDAAQEVNPRS